jgi:phage shock protein E
MLNILKKILGLGPQTDFKTLLKQGAIIIDVRSKSEYASGHVTGAINIPLDKLGNHLHLIKDKNQPIITCCASGVRSSSAKSWLLANGYTRVYNGGGWSSLQGKV